MAIVKTFRLVVATFAIALTAGAIPLLAQSAPAGDAHSAFGGIWVISPDAQLRGPDGGSIPTGGPGGGRGRGGGGGRGGGHGGGYGGGGGFGGGGGGGRGRGGARGEGNVDEREAIAAYTRTLVQPAKQMTIVPHDVSLAIAYDDGRTVTLEATNKKISSRAENGFVKLTRKSRWMDAAMVSEVEIEGGPKLEEKYEVIADGTQLRLSISTKGGGKENERTITHVYERPTE